MLTINEADTSVYKSEMLTVSEYVLGDGAYLTQFGEYTKGDAILGAVEMLFFKLYFQLTDLIYMLTGIKM